MYQQVWDCPCVRPCVCGCQKSGFTLSPYLLEFVSELSSAEERGCQFLSLSLGIPSSDISVENVRAGAHQSAMVHEHNWQKEPPFDFNKSYDERYGDEEDEASNCFWSSPDGVQHLRTLLEKEPAYENSPNWPQLVEWCSTCPF